MKWETRSQTILLFLNEYSDRWARDSRVRVRGSADLPDDADRQKIRGSFWFGSRYCFVSGFFRKNDACSSPSSERTLCFCDEISTIADSFFVEYSSLIFRASVFPNLIFKSVSTTQRLIVLVEKKRRFDV